LDIPLAVVVIDLHRRHSQEIGATKVSMPKHFGHSKVRKSKPGLSGSMSRNTIVSPHFWQRGVSITFTNTAYPQ
jgi:hypothetical protein